MCVFSHTLFLSLIKTHEERASGRDERKRYWVLLLNQRLFQVFTEAIFHLIHKKTDWMPSHSTI